MQLRFHPKPDMVVHWPGAKFVGQVNHYVGRKTKSLDDGSIVHEAQKDPAVVDSDTAEGRRLVKLCRRDGCLWPADQGTAQACGVEFVSVAQDKESGEWLPQAQAAVSAPKRSAKDSD